MTLSETTLPWLLSLWPLTSFLNLISPTSLLGLLASSAGKESTCSAEDPNSIPGSGRSPGEEIGYPLQYSWASLVAQMVKNLPTMQETWVRSLGQEDLLEKGTATHSRILTWKIPWTEKPGRLQAMGSQSWTRLNNFTFTFQLEYLHPFKKSSCAHIQATALSTQATAIL